MHLHFIQLGHHPATIYQLDITVILNDAKSVSRAVSHHSLKSVSHPVKPGVFISPFPLIQPDQDDNGLASQIELTTVLRKQAEHTLKVIKLQDSHTLVTREKKRQKGAQIAEKKESLHQTFNGR